MKQKRFLMCIFFLMNCVFPSPVFSQTFPQLPKTIFQLPDAAQQIPFIWNGEMMNRRWEPYAAMLIPVNLPNCKKVFYMQFDTGSPYSMFYRNQMEQIRAKYPDQVLLSDSAIVNYKFFVGNTQVTADKILLKEHQSNPIDWSEKSIEIIGTIGTDFMDKTIITLNFPKRTLKIESERSNEAEKEFQLTDFYFARGRILLPAKTKSQKTIFFFDTGASAYELMTDKETCEALNTKQAAYRKEEVRSWDRMMVANTIKTSEIIEIGNQNLQLTEATFMEGVSEKQFAQMKQMGIGGLIGNKLFLKSILLLDTKNKKFGIKLVK